MSVSATVEIDIPVHLRSSTPIPWATSMLTAALADKGMAANLGATGSAAPNATVVRLRLDKALGIAEIFAIEAGPHRGEVVIRAAEQRGLAYGLTELADRVRLTDNVAEAIRAAHVPLRAPAVPVRGILRAFSSDVLDRPWLCDRAFWTGYLDELATQRINRIHLALGMQYNYSHDADVRDNYLCFAYPFLLHVPSWEQVHVAGMSTAEREGNLAGLRFASDEAMRRGMHFQLGLWSHAVRPEIGRSPNLRYPIVGLADDDIAEYSAAALRMLLRECPSIGGVTFRVHYEGGVAETGRGAFWRTVLGGLREADRPLDVDLHAKGVDEELVTAARQVDGRVIVSAKYWAEHQGLPYHQADIRPQEQARPTRDDDLRGVTQNARRFTRYGYADFLRSDRDHELLFRIWPGTQRFLLWADPEVFAGYGRMSTIGGALGVELAEPLTFRGRKDTGRDGPRDLYADRTLTQGIGDWRKYAYEYRLWGRLLFDPVADRETWLRHLRAEFGAAAEEIEVALGAAGKVLPLVAVAQPASASNNFFWPELFFDLPLARNSRSATYGFDLTGAGTWGSMSPFDPALFECADDWAHGIVTGRPSGRYGPDWVAGRLERFADTALTALLRARGLVPDPDSTDFRRVDVDVRVQALLGRFFAGKVRAGAGHALFRRTGDPAHLRDAIDQYRPGREALAEVVTVTQDVYVTDLAFGDRSTERGHWSDRLARIDDDLADLSRELAEALAARRPVRTTIRPVQSGPRPVVRCDPPESFVPGEPLVVTAYAPLGIELTLYVRHLNQAQRYLVLSMAATATAHVVAEIPAGYTDTPYPLQFFILARDRLREAAWLVPGIDESLANQPYHIVYAKGR